MNNIADLGLKIISSKGFKTNYEVTSETSIRWSSGLIVIPKGFVTDLASIPPVFRNILPPTGKYGCASVAHDYIYRNHGFNGEFTQDDADLIFKRVMQYDGVAKWKVWVMYNAVQVANNGFPDYA